MAIDAAAEGVANRLPQGPRARPREPLALQILEWGTFVVAGVVLVAGAIAGLNTPGRLLELSLWLPAVVLADLAPVRIWGSVQLTVSLPVVLAAGMVFPPFPAFMLALLGCADAREFRGEVSLGRALFNRSNIALSVFAASLVFHRFGGDVSDWPKAALLVIPMLMVDTIVNSSLIVTGAWILTGERFTALIPKVYGRGRVTPFLLGYACLGFTALLLATVYTVAGAWGIAAFAIPAVLARLMFRESSEVADAVQTMAGQRKAIASLTERIANERRDERLVVAAGLHDDVLGPMYKVHLMGQVIKQDLRSGQLLQLEQDVPDLLHAAEVANDAIRSLIRNLRKSPLGPNGLSGTLQMLAQQLADETALRIEAAIEDVGGSPIVQLLAFQVAREAMNNAVRHSGAQNLTVALGQDEDGAIRLVVEDDGRGFDPLLVDTGAHFGLQLIRERVDLAGGLVVIESVPTMGTRIVARFPGERGDSLTQTG